MFNAKIIADSKNEFGNRITTFVVTFPRIILSEFNTHRMLSRNSASSRAIPFEKMLKSVEENPFIPIKWMKDHKGMQGNIYFEDTKEKWGCEERWLDARDYAIMQAISLNKHGVTKQFINRLLEPFMWHTVIVTATEYENFFSLRANDQSEIHMQKIAYMMLDEYNKSEPRLLKQNEWHIPFENDIDIQVNPEYEEEENKEMLKEIATQMKIKVATARCARVSYTVVGQENKGNLIKQDCDLHDKLLKSGHMSPFEHCALNSKKHHGFESNLKGFIQYRKLIENENKSDERVIKK